MALSCFSNLLFLTTVAALVFLPLPFYIPGVAPDLYLSKEKTPFPPTEQESSVVAWLNNAVAQIPPLEALTTGTLFIIVFTFRIFDWIQRKILEVRINKLNKCLKISTDRLRAWERHQQELENVIQMVNNASSEYNQILYLLLHENHYIGDGEHNGCTSETIFENV